MIFENYVPELPLGKFIESIIYFKNFPIEHSIERVVPTGHIFVIFELDGITRNLYNNETLIPIANFTKVWISGMHRKYISISAHQESEMLVIQFKPGGAYPFLHVPSFEFNEKIIMPDQSLGQSLSDLRDDLLMAPDYLAKISTAEKWLIARFRQRFEPSASFWEALSKILTEPIGSLNQIVENYPFSQKQLIEHFKKYVGLTPKYYQRILRFNEILLKIKNGEKLSWASLAYSCGYADQSHFIKEFSLFSGFNPKEFIHKDFDKEQTNFFPLDKKG